MPVCCTIVTMETFFFTYTIDFFSSSQTISLSLAFLLQILIRSFLPSYVHLYIFLFHNLIFKSFLFRSTLFLIFPPGYISSLIPYNLFYTLIYLLKFCYKVVVSFKILRGYHKSKLHTCTLNTNTYTRYSCLYISNVLAATLVVLSYFLNLSLYIYFSSFSPAISYLSVFFFLSICFSSTHLLSPSSSVAIMHCLRAVSFLL